jgi:ligand-binding sensor domain-containing protein
MLKIGILSGILNKKNNLMKETVKILNSLFIGASILFSCKGKTQLSKNKLNDTISFSYTRLDSTLTFKSTVRSIFEDSKGNFWFGSNEEGVCRYDGNEFIYFTVQDGLTDNQIRNIQEDSLGNIWFGTGEGVCYFNRSKILKVNPNKTILSSPKWKLSKNDLWFDAGNKNGVFRYDGRSLTYLQFPYSKADSLEINSNQIPYAVFRIKKDNYGHVLFGTLARGVVKFDGQNFTYFNESNSELKLVRGLFQDKLDNYWFGDNGRGLFKINQTETINITKQENLENSEFKSGTDYSDKPGTLARVWAIEQDSNNSIWIATIDAGIWILKDKQLTNLTLDDGLISLEIETIYRDRQNQLWFGTGKGGVYNLESNKLKRFIK